MIDLQLPASIDAEKAVLGSILLNREAITSVCDTLKADHFYLERHGQIYAAALACYQARTPPDLRTVSEELRRREQLDQVGGLPYLSDITDQVPTSYHVSYYATDVLKTATRRRLIAAIGQIAALAYNEREDVTVIMERAHDLLDGASVALYDPRYRPFTADDLDAEQLEPMKWVIPNLLPQGLTLLIGKPKMRKSWLALGTAIAVASGGRALGSIPVEAGDVLYLALEDSKNRLQSRQRKILSGGGAPRRLSYLTVAPRVDEGLIGTVETWLRKHSEARLVIVDVLAKVRPRSGGRGGSMYDEDYAAIGPLQQLAQRRGIAVLVIHHMNRSDSTDAYDMINGSNGVGGAADGLLTLQYDRGQSDAVLTISSREIEDDSSLALRWDTTIAQWIYVGKHEEVKASKERQEVLNLLREEKRPLGPRDVMEHLGREGEYARIKQLMYRMAKDGDLSVTGRGLYTLPSLTLLAADESNEGDRGDPTADHLFHGTRTIQTGQSNEGNATLTTKNLDHLDHLVTLEGSDAAQSHEKGNADKSDSDHLRYLFPDSPARTVDSTADLDWDYVRKLYAAGNLKAIQAHCSMRRQDYDKVLRTLGPALT